MGDIYAQVPQVNENGEYLVSDKGLYLNQTELQKVGNINPAGVGGLFNSFSYKNVFLDFSIDFRIGGEVINEMNQYATAVGEHPFPGPGLQDPDHQRPESGPGRDLGRAHAAHPPGQSQGRSGRSCPRGVKPTVPTPARPKGTAGKAGNA